MVLVILPRKMKVFDVFGTRVIKGGSLLSDFGVEKSKKWKMTPPYN